MHHYCNNHAISMTKTYTLNLGSEETSTTRIREPKLLEQQAGTITWTTQGHWVHNVQRKKINMI